MHPHLLAIVAQAREEPKAPPLLERALQLGGRAFDGEHADPMAPPREGGEGKALCALNVEGDVVEDGGRAVILQELPKRARWKRENAHVAPLSLWELDHSPKRTAICIPYSFRVWDGKAHAACARPCDGVRCNGACPQRP